MSRRFRSLPFLVATTLVAVGAHAEPTQNPSGIDLTKKIFNPQANPSLSVVFHDASKKATRILRCATPPCDELPEYFQPEYSYTTPSLCSE